MVVQQHVLNWLYSVLTSVRFPTLQSSRDGPRRLTDSPSLSSRAGIPRRQPDLQRRCPGAVRVPVAVAEDRCPQYAIVVPLGLVCQLTSRHRSFPQWRVCAAPPSLGHHPRRLPRDDLPIPHLRLGSACVPPRSALGVRDSDREYDGAPGAARGSAGPGLPSLSRRLVNVLGCMWDNGPMRGSPTLIFLLRFSRNPPS